MALLEIDFGIRYKRFRDGDAPDFDDSPAPINEREHGFSLRLQTHDSLDSVVDTSHSNWIEGVDRFFRVMKRPVVCRGRVVNMGIEADISIHWAHEVATVGSTEDVIKWAKNKGLA